MTMWVFSLMTWVFSLTVLALCVIVGSVIAIFATPCLFKKVKDVFEDGFNFFDNDVED